MTDRQLLALLRATCANGPANVLRALAKAGYMVRKRDD